MLLGIEVCYSGGKGHRGLRCVTGEGRDTED